MNTIKRFIPMDRPFAKQHQEVENRVHEMDKRSIGGIFYTNNATKLHVNALAGNFPSVEKIMGDDVQIHSVKFSWDYLNQLQEAVTSLFGKMGIHTANMSQKYNRIIIGVDELSQDIAEAIFAELRGLGFAEMDAYAIEVKERVNFPQFNPVADEADMDTPVAALENMNDAEETSKTLMPGGMLLIKNSNGTFTYGASLNFGYYFQGLPFLVAAGHACSDSDVGKEVYFVPFDKEVGGYPLSRVFLPTSYNATNRFKIGTIRLRKLGGNLDFYSIGVTESGLDFSRTMYNGYKVDTVGGTVTEGSILRICGMTTQYGTVFDYGACADAQASVTAYSKKMTNLIQLDIGGNMGTSGGPISTIDADGKVRLVGLASVPGTGTCYGVSVQKLMDTYALTPMVEGLITV